MTIVLPHSSFDIFPVPVIQKEGDILFGSSNLGVTLPFPSENLQICLLLTAASFMIFNLACFFHSNILRNQPLLLFPTRTGFCSFLSNPLFYLTSSDSKIKSSHNASSITPRAFTHPSLPDFRFIFRSWGTGRFLSDDS